MRCDEFETRLNAALDARRYPGDDGPLSDHASACLRCRRLAGAYALIDESLRWQQRPEAQQRLANKVLAEVAAAPRANPPVWSVWSHVALASAIALVIALVLPEQEASAPRPAPVAVVSPPPQVARFEPSPLAETPTPAVGQLAREATARYAALARNTTESLSSVWSLWPKVPDAEAAPSAEVPREPAALAELASGLRPLADSTTGALSFLFELLPQGDPAAEPSAAEPAELTAQPRAT